MCCRIPVRFTTSGTSVMQQIIIHRMSLSKMIHIICARCHTMCRAVAFLLYSVSSLASLFSLPLSPSLSLSTAIFHRSQLEDGQGPVLMTTVAMPVFSTKNETVSAQRVLQNRTHTHSHHHYVSQTCFLQPICSLIEKLSNYLSHNSQGIRFSNKRRKLWNNC